MLLFYKLVHSFNSIIIILIKIEIQSQRLILIHYYINITLAVCQMAPSHLQKNWLLNWNYRKNNFSIRRKHVFFGTLNSITKSAESGTSTGHYLQSSHFAFLADLWIFHLWILKLEQLLGLHRSGLAQQDLKWNELIRVNCIRLIINQSRWHSLNRIISGAAMKQPF